MVCAPNKLRQLGHRPAKGLLLPAWTCSYQCCRSHPRAASLLFNQVSHPRAQAGCSPALQHTFEDEMPVLPASTCPHCPSHCAKKWGIISCSHEQTTVVEDFNYAEWLWCADLHKSIKPHKALDSKPREINTKSCIYIICFGISPLEISVALPTILGKLCFFRCIHRIWPLFAVYSEEITDMYKWKKTFVKEFFAYLQNESPIPHCLLASPTCLLWTPSLCTGHFVSVN